MKTLREKSLACAIRQLDNTWNHEAAKEAYGMWEVFWKETRYKEAVKRLQLKLKQIEDERSK